MMPTKEETAEAANDIANKLSRLGFEDVGQQGPHEVENDDGVANQYFVHANKSASLFYVRLVDDFEFGTVVYPYSIQGFVGHQLTDEEIEELTDDIEEKEESENHLAKRAGRKIIEQTPIESLWKAKFNLSAYATTALVSYKEETADNDFPVRFQCVRGIFPYEGDMTLRRLNDRVETTLTGGDRGAKYAESSLVVNKEEKENPSEYVLSPQF